MRVALGEADGAVHRAVEVRFAPDALAAHRGLRCSSISAGVEVGVDRHLVAGHRVQGEPRRDFRDADRAVVDDDELDGDEHQEDDDADDEVAADDELAERHDHVAGRIDAVAAVQQDRGACRRRSATAAISVSSSSSDGKTENSTGSFT